MGVIYKIEHRESGKMYIGKTARTLEERMKEHTKKSRATSNSYIDRAIAKYGIDAFDVSVIEECDDEEKLNEREIYWIAFYNCIRPNGYNICSGGKNGSVGHTVSPETRAKISKANKGRKHPISPETRQKMIASRIANKKPVSAETRAKISAARKGKKLSPEICAKMSAGRKNKRAVVCIETGEVFESIAAAAKWANVAGCTVSGAVNGRNEGAGGYHWRFADAETPNTELELTPIKAGKRPVRCVETGEIFPSIRLAAKCMNLNCNTIIAALNQPTHTAGNYHWCDADSEMDETAMTSSKDRLHSVKCVETGQIFESISAAAKWINVCCSNIQRVLNQPTRTAGGYHWVDAN